MFILCYNNEKIVIIKIFEKYSNLFIDILILTLLPFLTSMHYIYYVHYFSLWKFSLKTPYTILKKSNVNNNKSIFFFFFCYMIAYNKKKISFSTTFIAN